MRGWDSPNVSHAKHLIQGTLYVVRQIQNICGVPRVEVMLA